LALQLLGQGGFAHLARAQQGHGGQVLQAFARPLGHEAGKVHIEKLTLQFKSLIMNLQG
jgi:hypothetical protein